MNEIYNIAAGNGVCLFAFCVPKIDSMSKNNSGFRMGLCKNIPTWFYAYIVIDVRNVLG